MVVGYPIYIRYYTGGNICSITDEQVPSYKNCIERIMCSSPGPSCYLRQCSHCPNFSVLSEQLMSFYEKHDIHENVIIRYKQWLSTEGRCSLEDVSKPCKEFFDLFAEKINALAPHSFIASQQAQFLKEKKVNLEPFELLVSCDFSENYSFVIQNEVQGYHWNNQQATIHPFVVYFKNEKNELQHWSYVIISECRSHDAVAIHLFISKLIGRLKNKFSKINKITYITDGTGAQYKNKFNFINLYMHKSDHGFDAEWHFHATSHGKGPCDGIGGTLKRKAARASLTRAFDRQITSAQLLYEWAISTNMEVDIDYSTIAEYEATEEKLYERFQHAKTIKGTQKYHCFIPKEGGKMQLKYYSLSESSKIINFVQLPEELV